MTQSLPSTHYISRLRNGPIILAFAKLFVALSLDERWAYTCNLTRQLAVACLCRKHEIQRGQVHRRDLLHRFNLGINTEHQSLFMIRKACPSGGLPAAVCTGKPCATVSVMHQNLKKH